MAAIPDHFDRWVRKAREVTAPKKREDLLLGLLFGMREWYLFNHGTREVPVPALAEIDDVILLLAFSSEPKMLQAFAASTQDRRDSVPYISIRTEEIVGYLEQLRAAGVTGVLMNPGDYAFTISIDALAAFDADWRARGMRKKEGFWIPNTTSEEDDFWEDHGVD